MPNSIRNGQTVTIYPLAAGKTEVTASLPDSKTESFENICINVIATNPNKQNERIGSKANGKVSNVTFKNASGANSNISVKLASSESETQVYTIAHPTDPLEYVYRIIQAYVPTYYGQKILDWKTSLTWAQSCDHGSSWTNDYCLDYFGLVSKNYSTIGLNYTDSDNYYSAD